TPASSGSRDLRPWDQGPRWTHAEQRRAASRQFYQLYRSCSQRGGTTRCSPRRRHVRVRQDNFLQGQPNRHGPDLVTIGGERRDPGPPNRFGNWLQFYYGTAPLYGTALVGHAAWRAPR